MPVDFNVHEEYGSKGRKAITIKGVQYRISNTPAGRAASIDGYLYPVVKRGNKEVVVIPGSVLNKKFPK